MAVDASPRWCRWRRAATAGYIANLALDEQTFTGSPIKNKTDAVQRSAIPKGLPVAIPSQKITWVPDTSGTLQMAHWAGPKCIQATIRIRCQRDQSLHDSLGWRTW